MRPGNSYERDIKCRTKNMLDGHRARAKKAGVTLGYTLDELRCMVSYALGNPCPYCGEGLNARNFSADHEIPLSRGGSFGIGNVVICCWACNEAKGALTGAEWRSLLGAMAGWPVKSRTNVSARLRLGGKAMRGG